MVSIISGNSTPPAMGLGGEEVGSFNEAFEAFSTLYDKYSMGSLTSILQPYKDLYLSAAGFAKAAFKGATFGGLMNNSGFNMQMIRAVTIRTQSASSPVYTWAQNYTTTGWQAMFGSKSNNYTTGIASSLGTNSAAYTLDRVTLFITHLLSHTPPHMDEIVFGIGQTNYMVYPVTYERISDVYVVQMPAPIWIGLNSTYYIEANIQRLGTDDTQLLGAAFVTSAYAALL